MTKHVIVDVVKRSLAIADAEQAIEHARAKQEEAVAVCATQIGDAMKAIAITIAYLHRVHADVDEILGQARLASIKHLIDIGFAVDVKAAYLIETDMARAWRRIDSRFSIRHPENQ